jgi:diadenosine tetraphosphate (Ap4A) HIT family hydrolase
LGTGGLSEPIFSGVSVTRIPIDIESYIKSTQARSCFICDVASHNPKRHHMVYEDEHTIAFLNKFPMLYGYVLVAPREHREQVTGEFAMEEYLGLQAVVHRVAEAVRAEVPTERIYIFSFGSQQGNSHVHWHIAPLPPGVPYEQQQFQAVMLENGILDLPDADLESLAARVSQRIVANGAGKP